MDRIEKFLWKCLLLCTIFLGIPWYFSPVDVSLISSSGDIMEPFRRGKQNKSHNQSLLSEEFMGKRLHDYGKKRRVPKGFEASSKGDPKITVPFQMDSIPPMSEETIISNSKTDISEAKQRNPNISEAKQRNPNISELDQNAMKIPWLSTGLTNEAIVYIILTRNFSLNGEGSTKYDTLMIDKCSANIDAIPNLTTGTSVPLNSPSVDISEKSRERMLEFLPSGKAFVNNGEAILRNVSVLDCLGFIKKRILGKYVFTNCIDVKNSGIDIISDTNGEKVIALEELSAIEVKINNKKLPTRYVGTTTKRLHGYYLIEFGNDSTEMSNGTTGNDSSTQSTGISSTPSISRTPGISSTKRIISMSATFDLSPIVAIEGDVLEYIKDNPGVDIINPNVVGNGVQQSIVYVGNKQAGKLSDRAAHIFVSLLGLALSCLCCAACIIGAKMPKESEEAEKKRIAEWQKEEDIIQKVNEEDTRREEKRRREAEERRKETAERV